MQEEIDAIDTVSRVVDRITKRGNYADFELSNGIILTLKPIPPLLLQALNKEFEPPLPPKVFMEEKGREEENPNHPEYLRLLERLEDEHNRAINNMVLGAGTSIKFIPEGRYPPESDQWTEQVKFVTELAGKEPIVFEKDGIQRYLQWLRFYALETPSDVLFAQSLPLQVGGIREREVEEVLDSFRSVSGRRADTESAVEAGSENGNSANRATRRASARDRGA